MKKKHYVLAISSIVTFAFFNISCKGGGSKYAPVIVTAGKIIEEFSQDTDDTDSGDISFTGHNGPCKECIYKCNDFRAGSGGGICGYCRHSSVRHDTSNPRYD